MSFELCLKCQHNRIWITNSPTGKCEHGRDQDDPCGCDCKEWIMFVPELTASQAGEIEVEIQRLESDPTVSKRALRLFMQSQSEDYQKGYEAARTDALKAIKARADDQNASSQMNTGFIKTRIAEDFKCSEAILRIGYCDCPACRRGDVCAT